MRKLIRKLLLREFRKLGGEYFDISGDSGNGDGAGEDEGEGGPPKDWPMEVINRLKKKGYEVFVRSDGIVPFKRQVYRDMPAPNVNMTIDALQNGITIAIGFARNENLTKAFAGNKFLKCDNAMETNNAMRVILKVAKTLQRKDSQDIHKDLDRLEATGAKDPEPLTQEDFLNSNSYLIDYYARTQKTR